MTTKEFAEIFNMTVSEICEFTKFSRQGLNQIVKGNSLRNGKKKTNASHALREKSLEMYKSDLKETKARAEERMIAINDIFGI